MTPEQEQWFIQSVQEMRASQEEMRASQREMQVVQQNQQIQIAEIREGQALLGHFFREALDRFDQRTHLMQSEMKEMRGEMKEMQGETNEIRGEMKEIRQEIRDLRRDFLEFLHR